VYPTFKNLPFQIASIKFYSNGAIPAASAGVLNQSKLSQILDNQIVKDYRKL
jgi:hypothetical protein